MDKSGRKVRGTFHIQCCPLALFSGKGTKQVDNAGCICKGMYPDLENRLKKKTKYLYAKD
jgi:hypothetical protein